MVDSVCISVRILRPVWTGSAMETGMVDSICICSCPARANYCIDQCLHWSKQLSTGQLRCYRFESTSPAKAKTPPIGWCLAFGGGWWIRTTEGIASRFTVCPLWPLGKSPIFTICFRSLYGAGRRTRTPDLLITNQLLYQLSYTGSSNRTRLL